MLRVFVSSCFKFFAPLRALRETKNFVPLCLRVFVFQILRVSTPFTYRVKGAFNSKYAAVGSGLK